MRWSFFANLALQLVLGLGAVWLGMGLVELFKKAT
jgi:hypothetical protein